MATKQQIKDAITARLTSNPSKTTKVDTEAYLINATNNLLDELYNTDVITDNELTTNVFTRGASNDVTYIINIKKQGGVVFISGSVKNNSLSTFNSVGVESITNAEYQTTYGGNTVGFNLTTKEAANVDIINNVLRILSPIPSGQRIGFRFFYFVNA